MGNSTHCCLQQINKPTELTFFDSEEPTMGRLTALSIGYLDTVGLAMFKLAAGCNIEALQILIRQGSSLLITDTNRTSLLHCASRSGSSEMVELLLREGIDVNLTDVDGWTSIHIAAELQRDDIVLCLLRFGANPCIKNRKNATAYQLISNHELKSLSTVKIANEEEIVESQKGRAIKLYELYKDREDMSIDQELEFSLSQEAELRVLMERKLVWSVWPASISVKLEKPEKQAPMFIELLELLMARNAAWAIQYIVLTGANTPETIAQFLSAQSKSLSRLLIMFIANPQLDCMHEVARCVFEKLLQKSDSLAANIYRLFSATKLPRQLLDLSFISETFALAWYRCCQSNLLRVELVQRLLFVVLSSAIAGKKKHPWFNVGQKIEELAGMLDLSPVETRMLMEFKPQPRPSKKYSLQEACLQGRLGQLVSLPSCKLFLSDQPLILIEKEHKYEYWQYDSDNGIFVIGKELVSIKQRSAN